MVFDKKAGLGEHTRLKVDGGDLAVQEWGQHDLLPFKMKCETVELSCSDHRSFVGNWLLCDDRRHLHLGSFFEDT